MSKYFKTSDDQEFYTEDHAQNHARSLADRTVTPPSIDVEAIAEMKVVDEETIADEVVTDEVATEEKPEPKKKK